MFTKVALSKTCFICMARGRWSQATNSSCLSPQRLRSDLSDRTKAWPMRLLDRRCKIKHGFFWFSFCLFEIYTFGFLYLSPFFVLTEGLRLRCIYTCMWYSSSPRDPQRKSPETPKVGFTAGLEACGQQHWTQAGPGPRKPPSESERFLVKIYIATLKWWSFR